MSCTACVLSRFAISEEEYLIFSAQESCSHHCSTKGGGGKGKGTGGSGRHGNCVLFAEYCKVNYHCSTKGGGGEGK